MRLRAKLPFNQQKLGLRCNCLGLPTELAPHTLARCEGQLLDGLGDAISRDRSGPVLFVRCAAALDGVNCSDLLRASWHTKTIQGIYCLFCHIVVRNDLASNLK